MANVITWVQTQKQAELAEIHEHLETKVMPKTPQFEVINKLEKAYQKNNIEELVFWLAYAKFNEYSVERGREFFKKIEELWASKRHPELSNKFHFLNSRFNNNEGNIKIILDSDLIPLFIENGDSEKELFVKCRHKNEETYLVKDKDYLIISHKDKKGVAIYISIPEYMADPEIEIPLANYKIPKVNTGHVGILLIDEKGKTYYYEFGRYTHNWDETKGYVRRISVPDIDWDGKSLIKKEELNKVLKKISKESGQNKSILGAYVETSYVDYMLYYANKKYFESVPKEKAKYKKDINVEYSKNREEYSFTSNNCGTFALDVIKCDKNIKVPWLVIKTSPNNIVDELHEEGHKKVIFDSKSKTTTIDED